MSMRINVYELPQNNYYKTKLDINDEPIFLLGDVIKGEIVINDSEELLSKAKSFKIQITTNSFSKGILQATKIIETIQFSDLEKIQNVQPFEFQPLKITYPTYQSDRTNIVYFLEAIVEKSMKTITETLPIVALKADYRQSSLREMVMPINNENPSYDVSISLKSTVSSIFDSISGKITVNRADPNSITNSYIIILTEEILKNSQNNKTHEIWHCKYQIMDGTPRPGSQSPFTLQLGPMKLWTLPPANDCFIRSKILMRYVVEASDGTSQQVTQTLGLYLPNIACNRQ
ncbi:hypothetical protein TVAG_129910 [Trichomonas vaginalis G3]|uniref:Arrestin-like N-terminal domain-containing protein n=1 Tax=Trichomonas vaginalis (strain ATCC PRA-98 / G3) TaxID=412133 RepID=A2DI87_TRIV3|nr:vacuolar protein sorting-associated protein 26 family [Trichomonas vaginalis G3]EAY19883.1 hypothetical protein TVAG_129910 [Trichomonas vaginalis G3]KAI5509990.1 vacuolar protein sorting-associated protein 26 family [Trichomonas vaginalis G3]|eukprot:XP_001580869.1 hypothetical protein [Trichomonas vaginalis G3]